MDDATHALKKQGCWSRLPGCGGNPTAELADEFRRFISQRTQRLDVDWLAQIVCRRKRAVLFVLFTKVFTTEIHYQIFTV